MKKALFVSTNLLILLIAASVLAHPHFQKTTKATLPGDVEASLSYFTVPGNMTHAAKAEVGAFVAPGLAKLELSSAVKVGSVSVPAGTYTVGAVKASADGWTMALSPGELGFGDKPDMSKLIKLDSDYSSSSTNTEHLLVDIAPGHGKFDGKAVLSIGFGSMYLSGAIAE